MLAFLAIYLGVLLAGYRRAGQEVAESGRLPWFAIVAPLVFAPAEWSILAPVLMLPLLFIALSTSPRDAASHFFWFGFGMGAIAVVVVGVVVTVVVVTR